MAVTVADLLATPRLRLTLVAGEQGMSRPVAWAHASDLEDPWEWLAGDELLMKNGRTLPAAARAQCSFVRRVADTGASGLVIGDDPRTPAFADAVVRAADRLGFPILRVPYSVGFVTIAREVAGANAGDEARRLARIERLYGRVRSLIGRPGRRSLLADIGHELGCELHLVDPRRGEPVLGGRALRTDLRQAAVAAVADRGGAIPGILRLTGDREPSAIAVELPYPEPTMLVAVGLAGSSPEIALLQHAATAVAVEMTTVMLRLEHERRTGAELLANLLDQRLDPAQARGRLTEVGLDPGAAVLAVVFGGTEDAERGLHLALAHRQVTHLLLRRGILLYVLMSDHDTGIDVLTDRLGDDPTIGVSAPVHDAVRVPSACREALWALATAEELPDRVVRYGDQAPLSALRNPDEAQALVDRTLGALVAYDRDHGTELLETLRTFLECRRSWQRTAQALNVHKHTVVYRMQRVEQLTGRTVAETADLAELWLAVRAHQILSSASAQSPDEAQRARLASGAGGTGEPSGFA